MRQFAEAELVIPNGVYAGRRFRCDRQPYAGLWFDQVDTGSYRRHVATGPTQSGKTLSAFVTPTLYHLFEHNEGVIVGLPHMEMASDKWREDIEPVIAASRYRDLLPRTGGGSRGGTVEAVRLRNGVTLRFMSGGGSDKSRAGYTSRVVVITEADGLDEAGGGSREADKITQLEARTLAYGDRARIYAECTVSVKEGFTWREIEAGTASRIATPCPHCKAYVTLEREHLIGHADVDSKPAAEGAAAFACYECGELWTEADRLAANLAAVVVHAGQELTPAGELVGEARLTDTLGFRWSAVNNMFTTAALLGGEEWAAAHAEDEDNAEKKARQFIWSVPFEPPTWDATPLSRKGIATRTAQLPRGVVPDDTEYVSIGVDLGKWLAHWLAIAWRDDGRAHVFDYGQFDVATDHYGSVEPAILAALRDFRELVAVGWNWKAENNRTADQVFIDSGYQADVVYAFIRESDQTLYRPAVGRGAGQQHRQWYNRPKKSGGVVKHLGQNYHITRVQADRPRTYVHLVEVNSDYWKTWLHQRLAAPIELPGSLSLYNALPREHLKLAKHFTAERETDEFLPHKGMVKKWIRESRSNHWLDAGYNACAAGHLAGFRLPGTAAVEPPPADTTAPDNPKPITTTPDRRAFIATQR